MRYYNPATDISEEYNDKVYYGRETDNCPSGAYIFKPKQGDQQSKAYSKPVSTKVLTGQLVDVIQLDYYDGVYNRSWTGHLR